MSLSFIQKYPEFYFVGSLISIKICLQDAGTNEGIGVLSFGGLIFSSIIAVYSLGGICNNLDDIEIKKKKDE